MSELPEREKSTTLFIVFTVMLDAMGIGLVLPVMPELLRNITDMNMADAAFIGGLMTFTYASMQFLLGPLLGNLSDAYGRRPVLILSLVCMGLDYFLIAWAPTLTILFIARIISGASGATYSTAAAYLSDTSAKGDRSANFGYIGGAFGIGFILGPALGGLIAEYGVRMPFVVAGGLALINAAFGFFVLPETLTKAQRRPFKFKRSNPFSALLRIRRLTAVSNLMIVTFLMAIATNVYAVIWSFFTIERFGWAISTVGWSLALYGFFAALVQAILLKWLIAKIGVIKTIIFGFIISILSFFWLTFVESSLLIFIGIPIAALGSLSGPALQGLMADEVTGSEQGELQGIFASVVALSTIVSPLIMNSTFKLFSDPDAHFYQPGAPFMVAAALMTLAAYLFFKNQYGTTSLVKK